MSDIVRFLETLAVNPAASPGDLAAAVRDLAVDRALADALLAGDTAALGALLGGRTKMICMIAPAENDEPIREDEQEDNDGAESGGESSRAA